MGAIAAARQRGSDYIDGLYGPRFKGTPADGVDQDRGWPRIGATAFGSTLTSDVIPTCLINAAYEAALLELQSPASLSVTVTPNKRIIEVKAGSVASGTRTTAMRSRTRCRCRPWRKVCSRRS